MLKIDCPWCGSRNETEFVYRGEAGTVRPIPASTVDDATWSHYLYYRRNEKGEHRELWTHSGGCHQSFVMVRDTATHAVAAIEKIEPS